MSEVVGFVLIFALVTTTIGFVYVSGLGALEDRRDEERVNNAERAFDVLADNIADIYGHGAPSRTTELKLAEARLRVAEPTEITISVIDGTNLMVGNDGSIEANDGTGNTNTLTFDNGRIRSSDGTSLTPRSSVVTGSYTASSRPIIYATGGSQLVYQNGAIVRTEPSGAVLQRAPSMRFDESRTVVRLIETRSPGRGATESVSGTTTALIRTERDRTAVLTPLRHESPFLVSMTVRTTPKRAAVWEQYLNSQVHWGSPSADGESGSSDPACAVDGATVRCAFLVTDRFEVVKTSVETTIG